MNEARSRHELRCTCQYTPLLAMYGLDARGNAYLHVKAWKGRRLITEVIYTGGTARILCKECMRWYRIVFRVETARLEEVARPVEIPR